MRNDGIIVCAGLPGRFRVDLRLRRGPGTVKRHRGNGISKLLDRIRWKKDRNLQMIEMDVVVKPIEAFGVVAGSNWCLEDLRRSRVRIRRFMGIFEFLRG